ncbi:MAG TPA: DinB family protein [Anaerolineales bacterium]|nr:DinB family protein [Anaerolineales bacterium]
MTSKYLPIEKVLTILKETPPRLAKITAGLAPAQLHDVPSVGEWSVNEVLAHLRACNEVWGGYYIMTILAQDHPTIKAVNPRTWIKKTDYLEQEFQLSLRAFTKQRQRLLAVLEPLPPKDWARTNTLIGAGKPLQQTLISHANGLARHERAHLRQIERTLKALQGTS